MNLVNTLKKDYFTEQSNVKKTSKVKTEFVITDASVDTLFLALSRCRRRKPRDNSKNNLDNFM